MLVVVACSFLALSFVLARVTPDDYDHNKPGLKLSRQPIRRRDRVG
jgi:hypothetical protein